MTNPEADLRDELVKWIPNLRAFALSLTRSSNYDDLVQDTLVKALSNLDHFEPGTNMRAWLFTILRHNFYNEVRYQKYHPAGPLDEIDASTLSTSPAQDKYMEFADVLNGLGVLLPEQREALILIAIEGLSYEEAASICGCPVGTVKSRLSRARDRLENHLNGESKNSNGNDSDVPQSTVARHVKRIRRLLATPPSRDRSPLKQQRILAIQRLQTT